MIKQIVGRLMNINRLWLLLILAIVLGMISVFLSSSYLKTREINIAEELKKQMSGGPTIEVLVSSRNLPLGTTVGDTLVKREVPLDLVDEDTLKPGDAALISGTKLTRPLRAGFPINTSYFVEKSQTFADVVEVGMRAITVEVDEINSMAQMVKPGNRVDLMLLATDRADPESGSEVLMVLQNVKVMATGQSVVAKQGNSRSKNPQAAMSSQQTYSNFTFEVSVQDAAIIALAQSTGKIRAILRNPQDNAEAIIEDVNTRKLLKVEEKNPERRKNAAAQRKQEISAEETYLEMRKSSELKSRQIEYLIGGMGSGATVTQGETLKGSATPAPGGSNQPNPKPSAGSIKIDELQNSIAEALKKSGVPSDIAGGARGQAVK